jgi:hypothetical protein
MTLGGKYKWKPDSNPPVGGYDIDSGLKATQFTNRSTVIKEDTSPYRRPKEQNPEPGQYDAHLKPFGYSPRKMTMGGKYKWKPDSNPPLGGYDLDSGYAATKYMNRSCIIKGETSPYRRPKEQNPEPGQYDAHLKPFGSDSRKMTLGGKYKWKPDSNPPIGGYDLDSGYSATQYMNRSTIIKGETSPYRRPKEQNPEPGQYDAHLKPFGFSERKMTLGGKYKWKADNNPPLGGYNPDESFKKLNKS